MATEETETVETEENEQTEVEANEASAEVEVQEPEADPAAGLKTALQKERADRKAAAKRVKELEQELADRDKPDDEKAVDAARREGEAAGAAKGNKRLIATEFRIAAEKRVKSTALAMKAVGNALDDIEVDDDGNVDSAAISTVLDALLEEYPDLAPSRFEGTADQGGKGKETKPDQLTRDDLKNMKPAAVLAADKAGQLDRLKGKIK